MAIKLFRNERTTVTLIEFLIPISSSKFKLIANFSIAVGFSLRQLPGVRIGTPDDLGIVPGDSVGFLFTR